jgi:hypothetical protein
MRASRYNRLLFVALFSTVSLAAESQQVNQLLKRASSSVYDVGVRNFEGTPYLDDNFVESVVSSNASNQSGLLMRYNIFEDNMEVQQSGVVFILDPDMRINKVVIGKTPFVVGKFEYKGKPHKGFLELLDSGKVSLFAKKIVEHKEREEPTPLKYQGAPERFVRNQDIFYYRIDTGELIKIDKMKNFPETLSEKKEEISSFIKKEKISKNREDLIKLFNYYNSLF